MTDAPESATPALAERAADTTAVIVGGGIAGLVVALEFAKIGMRVSVLETSERPGGAIRTAEVAGVQLDVGAESFAVRGGSVRALIDELGLADGVVSPAGGGAWIAGLPTGGAAPIPAGGVLGIPSNPWAPDVRRVIGMRGAWRAYLDRLRPVLTIGHRHSLGELVRSRLGARVLDRLVAPVVTGVYSARPDDIDVDTAAPGLNAALTRAGSLTGGVAQLLADRPAGAKPGSAVQGLRGGMGTLVDALVARLAELGVEVQTGTRVTSVARVGEEWRIETDAAGDEASTRSHEFRADVVVIATDEGSARRLIPATLPAAADAPQPRVDIVTLVVDAPALDAAPRGTGVLTVPGAFTAKALTHSTVKWPWLADALETGSRSRHAVRVSFGAQGEAPATAEMSDADAAALALAEASALLGVTLAPDALVDAHVARYAQSQPASVIGHGERVEAARRAVHATPGLGVVGAWLAGTGLAQVVPDAVAEAERLRRGVLFGRGA